MSVDLAFDGAVDVSATFVDRVDEHDKGGAHVHGAVKVNDHVDGWLGGLPQRRRPPK